MDEFEIFYSGVDDGGGEDGTVDLDQLTEEGDGSQEGNGGQQEEEEDGDDIDLDRLDKILKKKNLVAYDVHDPVLRKLRGGEEEPPARTATPADDDKELDRLLIEDPAGYAREVARRAQLEIHETNVLYQEMVREAKKGAPELTDEDFDALSASLAKADLATLKAWKKEGSHVAAAQAMAYRRGKAAGRRPNTQTPRQGGSGPERGDNVAPQVKGKLAKMGEALRSAGIDVKDEDIAGSRYMPKRK